MDQKWSASGRRKRNFSYILLNSNEIQLLRGKKRKRNSWAVKGTIISVGSWAQPSNKGVAQNKQLMEKHWEPAPSKQKWIGKAVFVLFVEAPGSSKKSHQPWGGKDEQIKWESWLEIPAPSPWLVKLGTAKVRSLISASHPPPKKEFPDVLRVGGTGEALTRRVVPWEMEGSSYLSPSHCEILSCWEKCGEFAEFVLLQLLVLWYHRGRQKTNKQIQQKLWNRTGVVKDNRSCEV